MEKFRVIGISNYTSIINRNAVVVELADLQEITFRTGAVTFIAVKLMAVSLSSACRPGWPSKRPARTGFRYIFKISGSCESSQQACDLAEIPGERAIVMRLVMMGMGT